MPEPITPEERMKNSCQWLYASIDACAAAAGDVEARTKLLIADGDSWKMLAEMSNAERDALRARVEELETRRQNAMHCLRELQYNHHLGPCDCYACLGLSAALGKEE